MSNWKQQCYFCSDTVSTGKCVSVYIDLCAVVLLYIIRYFYCTVIILFCTFTLGILYVYLTTLLYYYITVFFYKFLCCYSGRYTITVLILNSTVIVL